MRFIGQSPDGKVKLRDINLLTRSVGWGMTAERRAQVLQDYDDAMAIIRARKDLRGYQAMLKLAIAMGGQDQSDAHLAEKYARIDDGQATDVVGEPMRLTFDD